MTVGLSPGGKVLRGIWNPFNNRAVRGPGHEVTARGQLSGDHWTRTRAENVTNDYIIMAGTVLLNVCF